MESPGFSWAGNSLASEPKPRMTAVVTDAFNAHNITHDPKHDSVGKRLQVRESIMLANKPECFGIP